MTVAIAATACTCPQYGHFSDVVPGAYSSRAPHWVQWNVIVPGVVTGGAGAGGAGLVGHGLALSRSGAAACGQDGGRGGGTDPRTEASSGTSCAGVHAAMPFFQTSVAGVSVPARACPARSSASNGPCC